MSEDVPGGTGGALAGFGPGSRIAGYVLEEQIGAGGMAVVFRARDDRLERQVALKILAPALAADEAFRRRFIRESRAAAAVDDPHIIPVFEAGEASGVLFIAMRYVRGGDVRTLLTRSGQLAPGRVAEIVAQVSSALDAAHERGLVHRDVKPANMLLDSGGSGGRPDHVYLSDFGLSKGALEASGLTGAGQFLGTLDYISPEQIEGKLVGGQADQYALACAAFELLTGQPPFRRDEALAVMYAQLSEPAPSVTSKRPGLPPAVDEVFARALAKAPADRYPSCREFSQALRDALGIRPYDSGEDPGPVRGGPATQIAWPSAGSGPAGSAPAGSAPAGSMPAGSGPPPTAAAAAVSGPGGAERGGGTAALSQGPATQIAPTGGSGGAGSSGATERHFGGEAGGPPDSQAGRPRPWWRSKGALAAAVVVLVVLGAGGAYLATRAPAKSAAQTAAFLPPPGCSSAVARGKTLSVTTTSLTTIYGNPFGVQVSPDGRHLFASTPDTLSVLALTPGRAVSQQYHYYVTSSGEAAQGIALTSDGKYVLVAVGNGINVQNVAPAEQGASTANEAFLTVPGVHPVTNAVEVALSPGGQFAFVTLENSNELAVFNLAKAVTQGESLPGVFVGTVQLGVKPTGMAISPDGQWLYVTSISKTTSAGPSEGLLSVLNLKTLESHPAAAVVSQVTAGCSPVRVVASPDGKMVWVTARLSNDLLGFSAARLRSDPKHALLVKVPVGQTPTGLALVDGGTQMVVADTDLTGSPAANNLAVVDLTRALAGKPALIGYIPSGKLPREIAVGADGKYLYVSDNGSAQIQVVNLSTLP